MAKSDDYLLLAANTSTLRTQTGFVEAAITAWRARDEGKPAKSRKAEAVVLLREFYKQTGQYPKGYLASKHLQKQMGLSASGARQHVKFFLLWECRSYARLSEQDKQWIAKNFPEVWKPHKEKAKLVEGHFAAVRAAEREIAWRSSALSKMLRLLATTPHPTTPQPAAALQPAATNKSSRRTRQVTREWLIKKGFL